MPGLPTLPFRDAAAGILQVATDPSTNGKHQTGNIVNFIPGNGIDGLATKDNAANNAKVLLGSNGNTGTVMVNLTGLNTTSVVTNGQVRAVLQRIPDNGGAAVTGPETVSDQDLTVSNNVVAVSVPFTNANDGYPITLLPPANTTISTVAVSENSGQCLDDTDLSTADSTQYQQYYCEGGYQQMQDLTPVAGRTNTYTVADEHSGKCLDVSGASTADGAAVIQYTCNGQTNQMFTLNPVSALGNSHDHQLVAVRPDRAWPGRSRSGRGRAAMRPRTRGRFPVAGRGPRGTVRSSGCCG